MIAEAGTRILVALRTESLMLMELRFVKAKWSLADR
jgi:hypothetical protein